ERTGLDGRDGRWHVNLRVTLIVSALCFGMVPGSALAQRTLTTITRVNLRTGPLRPSALKRVLHAHTHLLWNEVVAESGGILHVLSVNAPGDSGWVAGESVVENGLGPHRNRSCGVLRWPVKTLSDSDAPAVRRIPQGAVISSLRAFSAPRVRPQNGRANAIEETEFGVSGNVIKWGLEPDSDLHPVLADADDSSQTIVLEVPDPACVTGATTSVRDSIATTRQDVVRALGTPPIGVTTLSAPVPVTVTGVGFFDFGHSIGHPPNAFELHPLLSIHFPRGSRPVASREPEGQRRRPGDRARTVPVIQDRVAAPHFSRHRPLSMEPVVLALQQRPDKQQLGTRDRYRHGCNCE